MRSLALGSFQTTMADSIDRLFWKMPVPRHLLIYIQPMAPSPQTLLGRKAAEKKKKDRNFTLKVTQIVNTIDSQVTQMN